MNQKIKLIKNNQQRNWDDLDWINEFYEFLQGKVPVGIELGTKIRLNQQQAFAIIWYLQEHFPVFPDNIEKCDSCGIIYDTWREGYHSEKRMKNYCGNCDDGKD